MHLVCPARLDLARDRAVSVAAVRAAVRLDADIVTAWLTDVRVILWGPGSIGGELLTAIIDHRDDLEIVGVKVYSEAKNGVDAGTLVGRDPVGVAATTDDDAIVALDADCVIYTPRNGDIGEVCRLLASGKNVATTVFGFYPPRLPDADRQRLESACRDGSTTFHASGINPGNLSGVLPLALSGMSRTIDTITLQERADMTLYDSTDISFGNMKFGEPPDIVDAEVDRIPPRHEVDVRRTGLATRRRTRRRPRRGHRRHRGDPGAARPPGVRSSAQEGHHGRPALEPGRAS